MEGEKVGYEWEGIGRLRMEGVEGIMDGFEEDIDAARGYEEEMDVGEGMGY